MTEQMKPSGIPWIGDIPSTWEIGRVKDYYDLQTGFTPDTSVSEYYDDENGELWVSIADMDSRNISSTKSKVSKTYIRQYRPVISPTGSLLYSFKLSVGKVSFISEDMYTNEAIATFYPQNVCLQYFYYSSAFIEENAKKNIYGAKILNQDSIKNAYVPFPASREQKMIADYLDERCAEIDSIIADIEKQIELLKQYKKSLITETVTKGLDKSVPMKDSGFEFIGRIPQHWLVEPIKNRTAFINGDRGENYPSRGEMMSEGIPFINAGHICNGIIDFENMDYISYQKYRLMGGVKLQPNDILYCLRGSIGKSSIVSLHEGTVASSLVTLRSISIIPRFLFYSINSDIEETQRALWDNGTAQPNLSAENLGRFKICIPPFEEQTIIVDYLDKQCEKIDAIISDKQQQLDTIQKHKKSLIYEYVTGKKHVKEAM